MNILTLLVANSAVLIIILLVLLFTSKQEHKHDSKEDLQKIKDQITE